MKKLTKNNSTPNRGATQSDGKPIFSQLAETNSGCNQESPQTSVGKAAANQSATMEIEYLQESPQVTTDCAERSSDVSKRAEQKEPSSALTTKQAKEKRQSKQKAVKQQKPKRFKFGLFPYRKALTYILDLLEKNEEKRQSEFYGITQKIECLHDEVDKLSHKQDVNAIAIISNVDQLDQKVDANARTMIRNVDQLDQKVDANARTIITIVEERTDSKLILSEIDAVLTKLEELEKKVDPNRPTSSTGGAESSTPPDNVIHINAITLLYHHYLKMKKCSNFEQVKLCILDLQSVFEQYEKATGEKLEWRL